MAVVELVYDADCPNVVGARAQLSRAFAQAGLSPAWREWRSDDQRAPEHVRGHGSPTVLVDGRDVAGAAPSQGMRSCRIYRSESGAPTGLPPADLIAAALVAAGTGKPVASSHASGRKAGLAVLPAIGVALLPKLACPACWPAYAGLLSAVGLGFLADAAVLLPLTATFLAVALGALAFRARRRRGYGPFAVGLVAAAIVLVGKFGFDHDPAMYAGLGLLVAASLWNGWPVRRAALACAACVTDTAATPTG